MNEYHELQKQAATLGLKTVGVTKEELKKMLQDYQPVKDQSPGNAREPIANTAIVFNGSLEVRRYTTLNHGKSFEKLAREFAQSRGYRVELLTVNFDNKCPNCGFQL